MNPIIDLLRWIENGYFIYKEILLSMPEESAKELQDRIEPGDLIVIDIDGGQKVLVKGDKICQN